MRTSTKIIDRGEPRNARPLTKIIGGILTSVNSYKKRDTLENHFKKLKGLKAIDMGCSVEFGSFYINHLGEENQSIKDLNKRIHKYYIEREYDEIKYSERENSLVTFFLQLSRYLQQSIGTVAAIDFNAYANQVNFKIDEEL